MKPALLALFLLTVPRLAAAQSYTVTDLGDLYPAAINNAGQVVGGDTLWMNGRTVRLNGLNATAINNRGQIVGFRGNGTGSGATEKNVHAFLWQNGKMRDLGTPRMPSQFYARGINDQGQVVGDSYRAPLLWQNGRITYFPKLSKDPPYTQMPSEASGINDNGWIVGNSSARNGQLQAVLWQGRRVTVLRGLPGCQASRANAINERGQIAGSCDFGWSNERPRNRLSHPVLWQNGRPRDLGRLRGDTGSMAAALNDAGQVVGTSSNNAQSSLSYRAFLWQSGRMLNLNALIPSRSAWHLDTATGINDRGQIVGNGKHNGKPRSFLLTPKL